MNPQTRQRGASPLAVMFVLVVLGFFGYIGLKLFPYYSESFRIQSSMKNLVQNEDLRGMPKRDIAAALVRRLQVNSVEFINTRNYLNYVTISEQSDGAVAVTVRYTWDTPLLANFTLVADFEKTVED